MVKNEFLQYMPSEIKKKRENQKLRQNLTNIVRVESKNMKGKLCLCRIWHNNIISLHSNILFSLNLDYFDILSIF